MIPQFYRPKLSENSILLSSLSLIIFVFVLALQIEAMKVHPMKRNLTIRDDIENPTLMAGNNAQKKKLRRLPHVFSKVLELPLPSDSDVAVEETSDCFKFVAEVADGEIDGIEDDVRALAVEIHPGVTKIVIRSGGDEEMDLLLDQLKVDVWRFRLPAFTRPELARAVFVDGKLTVTVPKGGGGGEVEDGIEAWGSMGRLVVVQ